MKAMLKLNEILNQALLKDKIEEIGIHSRGRRTTHLYLFVLGFVTNPIMQISYYK